jgi:hypothetical protein
VKEAYTHKNKFANINLYIYICTSLIRGLIMFNGKPKSTQYMCGLIYAENLHQNGSTVEDLEHEYILMAFDIIDKFDRGFRDYIHLLNLRSLKNG